MADQITSHKHPKQEEHVLSYGLVAWLDVLGFKRLLAASEDQVDVWIDVLSFLNSSKIIHDEHQPTRFQKVSIGLKSQDYRFTAFADTIVASVNLEPANDSNSTEWHWIQLFLMRVSYIWRKMFEYGLPARGGISMGRFFHTELGFAGKPFVEAEDLSRNLELAACAFTNECSDYLKNVFQSRLSDLESNNFWFRYKTPFKKDSSGVTQRDCCLLEFASRGSLGVPILAESYKYDFSQCDINKLVRESFEAHGKSVCDQSVQSKMENTVSMFELRKDQAKLFH